MQLSQNAHHHRQSGSDDYTSRSVLNPPRMVMLRRHTTSAALSPPPPPTIRASNLPDFPQYKEVVEACPHLSQGDLSSFWQGFELHQQQLLNCIDRSGFDEYEDLVSSSLRGCCIPSIAADRQCRRYWLASGYVEVCQDEHLSEFIYQAMAAAYDASSLLLPAKLS